MMTDADAQHPLLRVLNQTAKPNAPVGLRILPADDMVGDLSRTALNSSLHAGHALYAKLVEFWQRTSVWAKASIVARQKRKRLRVCESVSLGEKRFVAVVQVDGQQFLVGGAANSIAMLAQLEKQDAFSDVLRESCTREQVQ